MKRITTLFVLAAAGVVAGCEDKIEEYYLISNNSDVDVQFISVSSKNRDGSISIDGYYLYDSIVGVTCDIIAFEKSVFNAELLYNQKDMCALDPGAQFGTAETRQYTSFDSAILKKTYGDKIDRDNQVFFESSIAFYITGNPVVFTRQWNVKTNEVCMTYATSVPVPHERRYMNLEPPTLDMGCHPFPDNGYADYVRMSLEAQ